MSDHVKTPDEVISDVEAALRTIDSAPNAVAEAEARKDATAHALTLKRAQLTLSVTANDAARREAKITLATADLAHEASVARIAYNYAKKRADAADKALSGQQTIARLVENAMNVGGRWRV